MTQPLQPDAALDHSSHDLTLIAALADRASDLSPSASSAARERIASCEGCRDLFADLVLVRDALPAAATPARPRDFTLTADDARRLRSGGWRRVLGLIGSSRDAWSRPMAIGFTTIGVVTLLVTAAPLQLGSSSAMALSTVGSSVGNESSQGAAGGAGAAQEPSRQLEGVAASAAASMAAPAPAASASTEASNAAASTAASSVAGSTAPVRAASGGDTGTVFTGSNDTDKAYADADADQPGTPLDVTVAGPNSPPVGVVVAGICFLLGIGLFALRWASRRFADS